jgi:hypothetical protein
VTYGYDASVVKFSRMWEGVDTSDLEGYGKDLAYSIRNSRQGSSVEGAVPIPELDVPVYFIGHSLGGLVIQQALLSSIDADESLHSVADRTAAIMFMGTPLKGSDLSTWAKAVRKVYISLLPMFKNNSNKEILDVLDKKSPITRTLQKRFAEHGKHGKLRHLKMFCFYETLAMSGTIVVPKSSAVMTSDHSAKIAGTHRDIVKFSGKSDDGYKTVMDQLKNWTKNMVPIVEDTDDGKAKSGGAGKPEKGKSAKKKGGYAVAYGAKIHTISGVSGGKIDLGQTTAVAGDHIDMRYSKGKVFGKVFMQRDPAADEWGSSDQWGSDAEDPDSADESNQDESNPVPAVE